MNERKSFYDIASFYDQKAVLSASFEGMRYQLKKVEKEEKAELLAVVWPEPFGFEKTPEDKKEYQSFPYEEAGLDQAYEWICRKYEEKREMWEYVKDNPMEEIFRKAEKYDTDVYIREQ